MGARGQAMGNAVTCASDEWSILNNPAGMAGTSGTTVALGYDALPALPAFGKAGLAISTSSGTFAFGLGAFRFGDVVYNEQIVSVGAATRWNHTALGVTANYIRYATDGKGNKGMFTVSAGGITQLNSWLRVGARISNINQPWLSKQFDERLPTTLAMGLLFALAANTVFVTEVEKRINDVATGRAGLEFTVQKRLLARVGFQINPQTITGGLGFRLRYFNADYSMAHVPAFGTRHQASITIRIGKSKRVETKTTKATKTGEK